MREHLVWQNNDGIIEVDRFTAPVTPRGDWTRWALIPTDNRLTALRWALKHWREKK